MVDRFTYNSNMVVVDLFTTSTRLSNGVFRTWWASSKCVSLLIFFQTFVKLSVLKKYMFRTNFNCTGGAAGYIDRQILGINHVYPNPTSRKIYSGIAHDPEGLLGSLTSCVLCYLGVSIGHIIIYYKEPSKRVAKFLFCSFIYGIAAGVLCKFSLNDGWIPLNKNLW